MKWVSKSRVLGVLMVALCLGVLDVSPFAYAKTDLSAGEAGDPGDGDGITSTSGSGSWGDGNVLTGASTKPAGPRLLLIPVIQGNLITFHVIVVVPDSSAKD